MSAQEFNGDLAANAVTTVTFDNYHEGGIVVENLAPEGTADSTIYGTADGVTDPTVAGSDCFVIEAGDVAVVNNGGPLYYQGLLDIDNALIPAPNTVVKLISSGTPSYSVSA